MIQNIKINNLVFGMFLVTLFFFKLPNLYILPFLPNSFLTTQAIARILIVLVFAYTCIFRLKSNEKNVLTNNHRLTTFLIILFFAIQSLSIIEAINVASFLNRYKDVTVGICSLFVFSFYKDRWVKILLFLVLSTVVNLAIEVFILINPEAFLRLLSPFVYQNYLKLLIANLDRGRLYVPSYDELSIPFLFIPARKIIASKVQSYFLVFLISFIALSSNVRSNVLMLASGIIGSLVIFKRTTFKQLLVFLVGILVLGLFVNVLIKNLVGFSFYDRLTFQNELEDIDTITQRVDQINLSLGMVNSSLFGVGLGNYYDNLQISKSVLSYSESRRVEIRDAREYIHNIFATTAVESGYIGLFIFIAILFLFLKNDIKILKGNQQHKKAFLISFWVILLWGLFNPPVSGAYQFLFWGLRGLLL